MQCRYHVSQLGRLAPEFSAMDCEILVVLGDTLEKAQRYSQSLHLPFPVLSDPTRNVYLLFGLDKAFLLVQRTASVVIDRQGIIQYLKRANNPMTWLEENKELLQVVQNLSKPG